MGSRTDSLSLCCRDAAAFVPGQTIAVDGGRNMSNHQVFSGCPRAWPTGPGLEGGWLGLDDRFRADDYLSLSRGV